MSHPEHKVFDLELVGVPARPRRRWSVALSFVVGAILGASVMLLYYQPGRAERQVLEQRGKRASAETSANELRGTLTSTVATLESTQQELAQFRYENGRLMRDLSRLQDALERSDQARTEAERRAKGISERPPAARRRIPGQARESLDGERSPPPASVDRILPGEYEEEPEIRKIFVARSPGITLEDVARYYGVSVKRLRGANPGLRMKRGREGHFLAQGARVRIPVSEF